ncbi:PD-(D/E)XK nuclease domain-containing protein, partial [bacterium]|nr:PD-(D/E)XK nuclease domain-containing protein [bacterium]
NDFEQFRHLEVPSDFANEQEIEKATPESFLFQAGYLTIEKKESRDESVFLALDYPNEEVKKSITRLYLKDIYKIDKYRPLGLELWESIKALNEGNIEKIIEIFNNALGKIPYNDFPKNQNEYWYRSLFVMLLRGGAGITSFQESYTSEGSSDLVIPFDDKIIIIEFKFAKSSKSVPKAKAEGEQQVKLYAKTYENEGKKIITVVLVADNRKRKVTL